MHTLALAIAGYAVMAIICGYAVLAGDALTRGVSAFFIFGWIASTAVQNYEDLKHPQFTVAIIDVVVFVVLALLALRFPRNWLKWATAFQLLIVATHVADALDKRIEVFAYFTAYYVWSYGTIASVGVGAWEASRARRRRSLGA